MKKIAVMIGVLLALANTSLGANRSITISLTPADIHPGDAIHIECIGNGTWQLPVTSAKLIIKNNDNERVLRTSMSIKDNIASYDYRIPLEETAGNWSVACVMRDRTGRVKRTEAFAVADTSPDDSTGSEYQDGPIAAHNTITEYSGPATCIRCHSQEAEEMLNSLHMQWSGPTPDLTNDTGEQLGKASRGINTFCTYAMSSEGACFSCHIRADGNAPHPPEANDVDCLMCHNDTYQRKFISDPNRTATVINIDGEEKTYQFGQVDGDGNYATEPDFGKMPTGIDMVDIARTVHLPTNASCLRCHAKAGGGDWTKRGDMGMSSINPPVDEDVHLSSDGANLTCASCHSALNHKISGRGIDLRQTEAPRPTCQACHTSTPHDSSTLNRHAQGQVGCQVCHIREYAKGGPTELSRDWYTPVWNQAFCSGQGGFVGEEIKQAHVKPEYVWFDGTSYVYNLGETIAPDDREIYSMAKANGSAFDGNSSIVPIKRHFSNMALHNQSKTIIPPKIMWMFMTGDFNLAVQEGMKEQGMNGDYTIVKADAEMLITHGVEPKENAPSCIECHDNSGKTLDGSGILPLTALGYHNIAAAVESCTLCHERKTLSWETMHQEHRDDNISCASCHSGEPTGFIQSRSKLCSSCHENKNWKTEGHKKHLEKDLECSRCHTFS